MTTTTLFARFVQTLRTVREMSPAAAAAVRRHWNAFSDGAATRASELLTEDRLNGVLDALVLATSPVLVLTVAVCVGYLVTTCLRRFCGNVRRNVKHKYDDEFDIVEKACRELRDVYCSLSHVLSAKCAVASNTGFRSPHSPLTSTSTRRRCVLPGGNVGTMLDAIRENGFAARVLRVRERVARQSGAASACAVAAFERAFLLEMYDDENDEDNVSRDTLTSIFDDCFPDVSGVEAYALMVMSILHRGTPARRRHDVNDAKTVRKMCRVLFCDRLGEGTAREPSDRVVRVMQRRLTEVD